MSKYIKLEDLKWHSPDESIVKPLTEFYVTESDIAALPTIEVSEDAISREFALKVISDYVNYPTEGDKVCAIKNAPSVVPKLDQ